MIEAASPGICGHRFGVDGERAVDRRPHAAFSSNDQP